MFDQYKPLRNAVRRLHWLESLEILHAYFQFLEFDRPLPQGLGHWLIDLGNKRVGAGVGLLAWELDVLTREVLLHAGSSRDTTLRSWKTFSSLMNSIKELENGLWSTAPEGEDAILVELVRIAHRQFPWQAGISHPYLMRYFGVFDHPRLRPLVIEALGISPVEILQIGLAVVGHCLKNSRVSNLRNEINQVPQPIVDQFFRRFSRTIKQMRNEIAERQQYDANWAYTLNPLKIWPLIATNDDQTEFVCPCPTHLFRRITDGLYYDLVDRPGFQNAFGTAFHDYVGRVLRVGDLQSNFEVIAERSYGPRRHRRGSVDWILEGPDATIFVECKTKRLRSEAKVNIIDTSVMEEDLGVLSSALVQLYKTLRDALRGDYEHWQPEPDKPVFPMIVTLENWYAFGPWVLNRIDATVREELAASGHDPQLVCDYPYTIASVEELEMGVQYMSREGIRALMVPKTEGEQRQWSLEASLLPLLASEGVEQPVSLFQEDWNRIDPRLG